MLVTETAGVGAARCPRRRRQRGTAPSSGLDAVCLCRFQPILRERRNRSPDGIVVIQMVWWEAVLFVAAVIFAIYAFASIVGFRTRTLTRPTDRTAENMYDNYADPPRKQHRYARHHGGEGRDGE